VRSAPLGGSWTPVLAPNGVPGSDRTGEQGAGRADGPLPDFSNRLVVRELLHLNRGAALQAATYKVEAVTGSEHNPKGCSDYRVRCQALYVGQQGGSLEVLVNDVQGVFAEHEQDAVVSLQPRDLSPLLRKGDEVTGSEPFRAAPGAVVDRVRVIRITRKEQTADVSVGVAGADDRKVHPCTGLRFKGAKGSLTGVVEHYFFDVVGDDERQVQRVFTFSGASVSPVVGPPQLAGNGAGWPYRDSHRGDVPSCQ
jgi:hypothetical protein